MLPFALGTKKDGSSIILSTNSISNITSLTSTSSSSLMHLMNSNNSIPAFINDQKFYSVHQQQHQPISNDNNYNNNNNNNNHNNNKQIDSDSITSNLATTSSNNSIEHLSFIEGNERDRDEVTYVEKNALNSKSRMNYNSANQRSKSEDHDQVIEGIQVARNQLQEERWKVEVELLRTEASTLARILREERDQCRQTHEIRRSNSELNGLDSENRALNADIRHLQQQLQRSERQVTQMAEELRRMKSQLLNGSPIINQTPSSLTSSTSTSTKRQSQLPLMGDAESEHLILAGKRISHIHRIPLNNSSKSNNHHHHHHHYNNNNNSKMKGKESSAEYDYEYSISGQQDEVKLSLPDIAARSIESGDMLTDSAAYGGMDNLLQAAHILGPTSKNLNTPQPPPKRRRLSDAPSTTTIGFSALNVLANEASTARMTPPSNRINALMSVEKDEGSTARNRAPYIKWSLSEDEQLVKAIQIHGEKWESVSSEIPTRTYHQCRQRFIRGLKRGSALPPELRHHAIGLAGKTKHPIEDINLDNGDEYYEED